MSEANNNKIDLGIIPVGKINYKEIVGRIGYGLTLHDNAYRCMRYLDALRSFILKTEVEPAFIPAESVGIEGDQRLRLVVGYPYTEDVVFKEPVLTPWSDSDMVYLDAVMLCIEKMISMHCTHIMVICEETEKYGYLINWIKAMAIQDPKRQVSIIVQDGYDGRLDFNTPEVEEDEMVEFICRKSGVNKKLIKVVLDTEMEYLELNGIAECIER